MRIKLHIGLPKTGTTHLQQNLFIHRDALRQRGVLVPMSGVYQLEGAVVPAHHPLCWALQEERAFPEHELKMIAGSWDMLRDELHAAQDASTAVISSEAFYWELRSAEQIRRVRAELSAFDVDVVLVLRDVIRFSESMYGQYVARYGFTGDPLDFVSEHMQLLQFASQIRVWSDAFGPNNVHVLKYEGFGRTIYFSQFMRYLGVDSVADLSPSWDEEYQNFSVDRQFLPLIRRLNQNAHSAALVSGLIPFLIEDGSTRRREQLFSASEEGLLRKVLEEQPGPVFDPVPPAG